MEFPADLRYTTKDEWIRVEGDEAAIGITDHAQDQLGDIVFLELPQPGRRLAQGEAFGVIESVKAVSDLYMPAGGEVIARNEAAIASPERVNASPYGDGWMIRVRLADRSEIDALLDAAAYAAQLPKEVP